MIGRIVCGALAALLAVWALYLLWARPSLTYGDNGELEVSCSSVGVAGWEEQRILDDARSRSYRYRVEQGEDVLAAAADAADPELFPGGRWDARDRIEMHCDQRRTTFTAWMVLILAPASVLATLSLSPRRS